MQAPSLTECPPSEDRSFEVIVRRAGNRAWVTAQLIKADDGSHLWSERYDRDMTDVFEIQDRSCHHVCA
jgi:TolB-like protein